MSTQAKHTPGPWKVEFEGGSYLPYIVAADVGSVACIDSAGCSIGSDEVLANARLIASSPDLLEALKDSIEEHRQVLGILKIRTEGGEPLFAWLEETGAIIAKLRKAIAKAEGGAA